MQEYLMFQCYGPLVSWGEHAVGEERSSAFSPTRSAVLGLLAAGLGVSRQNDSVHQALAERTSVSVKVIHSGLILRDFHTVEVPPENKRANHLHSRKNELLDAGKGAIISYRSYLQDAYSIVSVSVSENSSVSLAELKQGLLRPIYPLFLGRRACPAALPLWPQLGQYSSAKAALDDYPLDSSIAKQREIFHYHFDHEQKDLQGCVQVERNDEPVSRARRQFKSRRQYSVSVKIGDEHVSQQSDISAK